MAAFSSEGDLFQYVLSRVWQVSITKAPLKCDFKGRISTLKSDRIFFQGGWGGGGGGAGGEEFNVKPQHPTATASMAGKAF